MSQEMERTSLGVRDAPLSDRIRLELNGLSDTNGLHLELLHDTKTGTFARVLRGAWGHGELSRPVAVKMQRDDALSREESVSVTAKFDMEHGIYRHLQGDGSALALKQYPIVQQF